jgi:hypothetical protein
LEIPAVPEKLRLVDRELTLHQKVVSILSLILADSTLKNHLRTIHIELNLMAASDEFVADTLSNSILAVFHDNFDPTERSTGSFLAPASAGAYTAGDNGGSIPLTSLPRLILKL